MSMFRLGRFAIHSILVVSGAWPVQAAAGPLQVPTGPPEAASRSVTASFLQEPPFSMRLGARIQLRLVHAEPDGTTSMRVRRARLSISGSAYEHFDYTIQAGLEGSAARLLDANVRISPAPFATVWAGQGKALYGRQQLNSSANLHFVDRTIVDGRFAPGRDQGLALLGRLGGELLEYNAGIYNGEGINRSVNENRRFMKVARLVLTPLGAYPPVESAHDRPAEPRLAFGVAGLRNTLGEGAEGLTVTRAGSEAAFKLGGFSATAELHREWAEPVPAPELVTDGWYVQAGYLLPGNRHEIAGRYATIDPETPVEPDLEEKGVAYTYYFSGHRAKVQADFRDIRNRTTDTSARELRLQLQLAM